MSNEAIEYHSKDFKWDKLRQKIENDPSLVYHLLPFEDGIDNHNPYSSSLHLQDSDAWNKFHTCHSTGKFFKERRYLLKEFPELASFDADSVVLEVGCGNGSSVLPILRAKDSAIVYACDCSSEALERAKEIIHAANVNSPKHRFHPFCCDFSVNGFPKWLACNSCKETFLQKQHLGSSDVYNNAQKDLNDAAYSMESTCCIGGVAFVTLIFTLSAVPPYRMPTAISECFSVLKPGGLLLFRDYGLYDMTMLRFESNQKVGFREYKRSDGTRSYFFSLDSVRALFTDVGFFELELEYCCIKSLNRRNGKTMQRVWVHGKFQKPIQCYSPK